MNKYPILRTKDKPKDHRPQQPHHKGQNHQIHQRAFPILGPMLSTPKNNRVDQKEDPNPPYNQRSLVHQNHVLVRVIHMTRPQKIDIHSGEQKQE